MGESSIFTGSQGMRTWLILGVLRWNTDGAMSLLCTGKDMVQETGQALEFWCQTVLAVPLTSCEICGK